MAMSRACLGYRGVGLARARLVPACFRRSFSYGDGLSKTNFGVIVVPQQQVYVMERFGKFSEVLYAGIHLRLPGVFRIAYVHSLKERAMHVESQQAITADNVSIKIDGVVYIKITDPKEASYGVTDPVYAVTQLAQTTMRSELGKMELDNTLKDREALNTNIVASINRAALAWGIECLRYEIKDITMSPEMKESMAQESMAERSKRAAITQSEGLRQSAINIAEGDKKAVVLRSEAALLDTQNRAIGEAEAIKAKAEASAKGISMVSEALAAPHGDTAATFRVAEQYVNSFGQLARKSTTLIVPANPHDAAGMVGQALGVFGAISKRTGGGGGLSALSQGGVPDGGADAQWGQSHRESLEHAASSGEGGAEAAEHEALGGGEQSAARERGEGLGVEDVKSAIAEERASMQQQQQRDTFHAKPL